MLLKKEVSVSLGATLKLYPEDSKCFEFIRLDVTFSEEIHPQANVKEKYREAWATVEEELFSSLEEMRKKLQAVQEG